jgi:hypothetical protein
MVPAARVARSVAWTVAERGAATRNGACSLRDFEGTSGMIRHLRRVEVWSLLLLALLAAGRADAMCNAIPTADRTFSSAAGAVDRPFASPGRQVKLMLGGPCDGPARFEPEPGRTKVALTFESFDPAVPPRTVVLPPASIVTMMTNELVFAFPDTGELTGQLFTGPVTIRAIVDDQVVASIDELGTRDASCGALKPHPIFRWFTALPPSNNFHCVAKPLECTDPDVDPTVVRATIDRGGNLLVPWDWSGVFPPGQGSDPIARLVRAGQSGLEAFPAPDPRSGTGIIIPSAAYVSSHTLTGGVLPPFLDVGPPSGGGPFPGSVLVGTVDSLEGLLRIAHNVGTDPAGEIFDLRSRLDGGVGPILITSPLAREERLVDLRSVRAGGAVTALEEPGNGPGTAGLLVYDNRNGRIGRVAEAAGSGELPRRVAVSNELAAFYDLETDLVTPDLTVLPIARLPAEGVDHATDVPTGDLIATGLFGSHGEPLPPSIGPSVVGGFAGPEHLPALFDLATGDVDLGRPLGGGDLVEEPLGIRHRHAPERFAAFGGKLAALGASAPGHAFALGNRAVFLVCDGDCVGADGRHDTILKLLDTDGSVRELARNVGVPVFFTGSLVGLATYENARYGSGDSGVEDLDADGALDGVFLSLFDVEGNHRLLPEEPNGGLIAVPPDGSVVTNEHVLIFGLDEATAGPLNCDDDRVDRVVVMLNARTGQLLNTREPMATSGFSQGRGLVTYLQPEDVLGRPLGRSFLTVLRDSDGDEVPDPYDDCPLAADLGQVDSDEDGIGDACDAACVGMSCGARTTMRWPGLDAADRRCLRSVARAADVLLDSDLKLEARCYSARRCAAATRLRARAVLRAIRLVGRCPRAVLAEAGLCGTDRDALIGKSGDGCLATTSVAAVRSMVAARRSGPPASDPRSCQRRLDDAMTRYGLGRHRRLVRCRDRILRGAVLRDADGVPLASPADCEREADVARDLARLGRETRKRIARACSPATLAGLDLCGDLESPTLDALVSADGTGGCLVSSHRAAVRRLLAEELGTVVGVPDVSATAVPCPPRPTATPSPQPSLHMIQVRLRAEASDGRRAELDAGWTGLVHDQQVLTGAGFDAHLFCDGAASVCPFFGADAGLPFGAPAPISGGGVGVCATIVVDGVVSGTFDTSTGALTATVPLKVRLFNAIETDIPCPACVTADGVPNLGEAGTCSGGPRSGLACTVGGLAAPAFGIAAGTSNDCPPNPGALITVFHLDVPATTGTVSWTTTPESPSCSGRIGSRCLCAPDGQETKPNSCIDDSATPGDGSVCAPIGNNEGVCPEYPLDQVCAEQPWRGCLGPSDCTIGDCVTRQRPCFLDPIVRVGRADPPVAGVAAPTLVGNFCLPRANAAVNAAGGLPGPAAFVMPAEVHFQR